MSDRPVMAGHSRRLMSFAYNREQIARPLSCHACKSLNIRLIDARVIKPDMELPPDSWPLMYYCDSCKSSVSTRKGTSIPLGFMARRNVRRARQKAHAVFDSAWKTARISRSEAYRWLARELGMSENECHIAMFDKVQCQNVIEICTKGIRI